MKGFRILFNSLTESFVSVGRNISLSIASISCISITLILVSVSIILSYNINSFTTNIEKDMTIVVFVDHEATNEQVDNVGGKINNLSNIENVSFQSKEQTRREMEKESVEFKGVLENYTAETNPLRDSFLVKVKDIDLISNTAKEIDRIENVVITKYGEGKVEELVKVFGIVKNVGYVAVCALVLVTVFLISNTIKITISNRKREIEIMRLVGASNSYIKLPFFFEGIWLGLIGSIIPIFVCCYGYILLFNKLGGQLFTPIIKLVRPDLVVYNVVIIIVLVGVLVGGFGSYGAVRRHLKI